MLTTTRLRSLTHRIGLPILALFVVVAAATTVKARGQGLPSRNDTVRTTVTLSASTVKGGTLVTGTVTMTDLTGSKFKGATVSLSSSNTAVATVPASITIPASTTSAVGSKTFTITTYRVTANKTVTITAAAGYNGPTRGGASLTVTP